MTNEEKTLLIAYLIDAGDIDPDGDVEDQFMAWCQVREDMVLGETHYKAISRPPGSGSVLSRRAGRPVWPRHRRQDDRRRLVFDGQRQS